MKQLRFFLFAILFMQADNFIYAQHFQSVDTVKAPGDFQNIYNRHLYGDSLVSSFVIIIKKEVRPHKHATHTEHVYILEGTGEMTLGNILKLGRFTNVNLLSFSYTKAFRVCIFENLSCFGINRLR